MSDSELDLRSDEELAIAAKTSVEAEGALLSRYLRLIRYYAGRFANGGEIDDLVQEGLIALLQRICWRSLRHRVDLWIRIHRRAFLPPRRTSGMPAFRSWQCCQTGNGRSCNACMMAQAMHRQPKNSAYRSNRSTTPCSASGKRCVPCGVRITPMNLDRLPQSVGAIYQQGIVA